RPGLALYAPFPGVFEDLEDAMAFVSVLDQVKVVPAGARVGYGGTFVAERETRVGIVPAGYADGVPRSLSGRGRVLVNGAEAPILGRVSMDLTAVDLTDLSPAPGPGAEVLFFGEHGGARLPVADTAERAGTVSWEVLCGVGPRVPRVILEGGRETCVVSRFFGSPERAR
ncbi:MAG: alanine racemase, partial [Acidobacteria bacterium]|nr:alanine racemase [Acidobacteriota bacterium]